MKVFEEITVKEVKKIPKSITCNKCGKSINLSGATYERQIQAEKFPTIKLKFGYGSKFDDETWSFELCEECLIQFINTFKYPPKIIE